MSVSLKTTSVLCLLILCSAAVAEATLDPSFELDPKMLSGSRKSSVPAYKKVKRPAPPTIEKRNAFPGKLGGVYTIKPGDRLLKTLMREYRLSHDEAVAFFEEIRVENNILDINLIKSGQKIIIPPLLRSADGSIKPTRPASAVFARSGIAETEGHSLKLDSPASMLSEKEAADRIRETWEKIVPAGPNLRKPLVLKTPAFSLTLDAQRYPMLGTMDGGRILIDQGGAIPPLVKSLILENEPSLKIVSDSLSGTKPFLSSMLEAGGFYSVEENFSMDFGDDPKLTVNADYKIEKTPESLINRDIILMNSGFNAAPPALGEFLKKEGFSLYEPFAGSRQYAAGKPRTIYQITAKKQPEIVDAILKVFSISADRERQLDVFADDNNGISLAVKAEKYFERGGERFVITAFNGDPVSYTLFRILETKGFQVVMLDTKDDFNKVLQKILSRLKIKGTFAKYNLVQNRAVNYSLQMTGCSLDDAGIASDGLFLTNLEMDRIIQDLLTENGYNIYSR